MGMYLMMLYVSLEQEEAVKGFFSTKGWSFQKPDLSVLTDRTGPLVIQDSEEPAFPVEIGTVEQTEANVEPVRIAETCLRTTSIKPKVSPKHQKKKGKVKASKRSASTENQEFEDILKEAELIAASVSEMEETGDDDRTEAGVKLEQDRESFIVEQNDNYDDTYDDYDDFNEEETGDTEQSEIDFVNDSVMQSSSVETPARKKRKLVDKSESPELTDVGDSLDATIKEELEQERIRRGSSTGMCTICGKVLYSSINRHMQLHQAGGYRCEHCDKLYLGRDKYEQHIRTKHMGLSAGQCDVCGKNFMSVDGYQNHMKVHQDDFKCECTICGMRFVKDSTYRKHIRTHSTKRPFCCSLGCGKTFKYKHSLKRHTCKVVKEPPLHVCEICKKMFTSSTNLKEHKRLHSDSLDYVCKNCGRMFRWHTSLARHQRSCLGIGVNGNGDNLTGRTVAADHVYASKTDEKEKNDSEPETDTKQ